MGENDWPNRWLASPEVFWEDPFFMHNLAQQTHRTAQPLHGFIFPKDGCLPVRWDLVEAMDKWAREGEPLRAQMWRDVLEWVDQAPWGVVDDGPVLPPGRMSRSWPVLRTILRQGHNPLTWRVVDAFLHALPFPPRYLGVVGDIIVAAIPEFEPAVAILKERNRPR